MSKRTTFTTISVLPPGITREVVIDFLHNHEEMIDLNPLVKERHRINPPPHATPDEFHCVWYSLTDKISYLPGGLVNGDVTYTCAFHDLPNGIQTHCYAPAGLNIRDKWTLNGSLPGEPIEPVEIGIGAPLTGLYIREDVDMRCNVIMASFVKKTLKKSHAALVERLKAKAQMATASNSSSRLSGPPSSSSNSTHSGNSRPWTPSTSSPSPAPSSSNVAAIPLSLHPGRGSSAIFPPYQPSTYTTTATFQSRQSQPPGSSPPGPVGNFYRQQVHRPQSQSQKLPEQSPYESPPLARNPPPPYADSQADTSNPTLYPDPLRLLRQDSVTSVYPDANGHATWQTLKSGPSVKYREGDPNYPQMNPYTPDGEAHRLGTAAPAPALVPAPMGGTLNGPFIAELE